MIKERETSTVKINADTLSAPQSAALLDTSFDAIATSEAQGTALAEPGASNSTWQRTDSEEGELNTAMAILLRDGLDQPIRNLPVKIEVPNGATIEANTDDQGAVVIPSVKSKKGTATLSVQDETGKSQEVCKIDLEKCNGGVAIARSPKVAAKVPLKPHHRRKPAPQAQKTEVPPKDPAPTSAPNNSIKEAEAHHGLWFATNEFSIRCGNG
jgi:hypothetical protein